MMQKPCAYCGDMTDMPFECNYCKDRQNCNSFVNEVLKKWNTIDVLVNNAGLMPLSFFKNLKYEEWDQMIDVNIKILYWRGYCIEFQKIWTCCKHFICCRKNCIDSCQQNIAVTALVNITCKFNHKMNHFR